jgi:predicted nucleotidyltransferase
MAMFTADKRAEIMEYIKAFAEKNEHIISLIAVGSGAVGYTDRLSDLDMVIAIDSNENLTLVMDEVAQKLKEKVRFIYFKQVPQIRMQVYMSEDYLEIDIGYGVYTSAAAFKKHWKVLFDKSGTVDNAMRRSWEAISAAPKGDELGKKLFELSDTAWHHLMHSAVAISREQYWRAESELEFVRNQLFAVWGCRYSLDVARGRDADSIPKEKLDSLKGTLPSELSGEALKGCLYALTGAVYSELESCGTAFESSVTRDNVAEYISACIGEQAAFSNE